MRIGQSKAKIYMENDIKVNMNDVAEIDEAKEELVEVIEFLQTPEKFTRIGGRIPKGVLLVDPPGTGKTLLAARLPVKLGSHFFRSADRSLSKCSWAWVLHACEICSSKPR